MSDFKYTSSRCTNHLALRYVRREGSIYSVLLLIDGAVAVRFEPNGLGQLADWLSDNAEILRESHEHNIGLTGEEADL